MNDLKLTLAVEGTREMKKPAEAEHIVFSAEQVAEPDPAVKPIFEVQTAR
jgi:hypothetical protein